MAIDTQAATTPQRRSTLLSILLGAAASLGLMLWVGRHNASLVLVLMFTVWVASPFAGMLWLHNAAKGWGLDQQSSTSRLVLFMSFASVAVYAAVVFLMHLKKPAGPFLAVPALSWVLIAILLGVGSSRSRAARK